MNKFICPIPWVSLSLGAQSAPRLCCHQIGGLDSKKEDDLLKLDHLKVFREQMLKGEVPAACQGCFDLEKAGCISPRHDYINRFGQNPVEVAVRYLDVTFNNECNLECLMCSPLYSYKLNNLYHNEMGLPKVLAWQAELNEKMLKEILPNLEMITLTGGEPFISKRMIDFIKILGRSGYAQNITLRIYSNLTNINAEILKLISVFKKVDLLLSIDSVGENYELIRYPASWKKIKENVTFLNANRFPHLEIHLHAMLMTTNWNSLGDLIEFYQSELARTHHLPIFTEIDSPSFMHPGVLPESLLQEGLNRTNKVLDELLLGQPAAAPEVKMLRSLLDKIVAKREPNLYLQYKVFLAKAMELRKGTNEK